MPPIETPYLAPNLPAPSPSPIKPLESLTAPSPPQLLNFTFDGQYYVRKSDDQYSTLDRTASVELVGDPAPQSLSQLPPHSRYRRRALRSDDPSNNNVDPNNNDDLNNNDDANNTPAAPLNVCPTTTPGTQEVPCVNDPFSLLTSFKVEKVLVPSILAPI